MRLLPYCITEAALSIDIPATGVRGMTIETVDHLGLRCLFSPYGDTVGDTASPAELTDHPIRESAIVFNRVLQYVFRQVAIIPFRFPTVLEDHAELANFLREHHQQYARALARLRNKVQVEMRVTYQRPPRLPGAPEQSGLDYMRNQQTQLRMLESAVNALRAAGAPWIEGWRERQVLSGVRCYALLDQPAMPAFIERLGSVDIAPELSARVTGPWPASEFIEDE